METATRFMPSVLAAAPTPNMLEHRLAEAQSEHERLQLLLQLAWQVRYSEPNRSLELALQGHQEAKSKHLQAELAQSLLTIGFHYYQQAEYAQAVQQLRAALQLFLRAHNLNGQGQADLLLGSVYARLGDYAEAVGHTARAYNTFEQEGDYVGMAWAINGLAWANLEMGSPDQALEYFEQAVETFATLDEVKGMAHAFNGIGAVYTRRASFGRALEYQQKALQLCENLQFTLGIARCQHCIGQVYFNLEAYDEALRHYAEGLKLYDQLGHKFGQAQLLVDIGQVFLAIGSVEEAFMTLFKALDLAHTVKAKVPLYNAQQQLAEAFARSGSYEKAWQYHRLFHELREQVVSDEARGKLRNQEIQFMLKLAKNEAEVYQNKNTELAQVNSDLERVLLLTNDSIEYARRIQEAMLPRAEKVHELLPQSFIYFKPRDVVSGDFYWITEWNDRVILAAVDCTGHGVPGAFMSVLGNSLLSQIVREKYFHVPSQILEELDELLTESLQQANSSNSVYDGMEAAIITLDLEARTVQYAGANVPLYVVGMQGLVVYNPTHYALGGTPGLAEQKQFENQMISLQPGDTLYLFSDGFRDQFGVEEAGKQKYSTRRFKQLLTSIYPHPMPEQRELLAQEFDAWKGSLKQLDDVMVLGVRIP